MKRGFTLIELVLVITILGVLAVSALPSFINVSTQAEQALRDATVGAVRAGIALKRADDLVVNGPPGAYPATLGGSSNSPCSATNACFGNVLPQAVTDGNWARTSDKVYTFNDGTAMYTYTYNQADGTFTSPTAP